MRNNWKKVWLFTIIWLPMIDIQKKKKIAVVFSGGGIKAAAFHIGVCLALKEKGFVFAGGTKEDVRRAYPENTPLAIRSYVGSSAGSFIAAILSAGYSVESLINAFDVGIGKDPHFKSPHIEKLKPLGYRDIFNLNGRGLLQSIPIKLLSRSLFKGGIESFLKENFKMNGLFTTKKIEKYLREHALYTNDFNKLGVDLYIVGTQLNHSRKVIFGNFQDNFKTERVNYINYANISEAVAASTSLPPVFAPYKIRSPQEKDMYFYDGEVRDTLSTHVAMDSGADLIIASYSVQPYHYTQKVGSLHKFGIPVILNQALYQVLQQKIDRHRIHIDDLRSIYQIIDGYFKNNNLPDTHKENLLALFRERTKYNPSVDTVYVHPRPQNYEMFFADHFSLNSEILEKIVRIGFRSALSSLRHLKT